MTIIDNQSSDSKPEPSPGIPASRSHNAVMDKLEPEPNKPAKKPFPYGCITLVAIILSILIFNEETLNIASNILGVPLDGSGRRSTPSRVGADLRGLSVAIETYFADTGVYPAWTVGQGGANAHLDSTNPAYAVPTFVMKTEKNLSVWTLTTPLSYCSNLPTDRYAQNGVYAYWAGDCKKGWILYSPGPDRIYDIVPEKDYVPGAVEIPASLINKTYDPSNGAVSRGDIYRVKQAN